MSASFLLDGRRVLALDGGGQGMRRPFLYPVLGPSGLPLTRMGHPHDPATHSHHNSIWISHHDVQGADFWADNGGTIEITSISRLDDSETSASLDLKAIWKSKDGTVLLHENRRITLLALASDRWRIDIDTELAAPRDPVTLGSTPFGFLGVRMAKSIGVLDGGGRILSSEGGVNEAGCFRKPARWVDYSGPVTTALDEGITLMDHPQNLHHPVEFHVRDDGWMGAATTFRAAHTITPDQPLRLKHGLLVHSGLGDPAQIQRDWESFSQSAFDPFPTKRR